MIGAGFVPLLAFVVERRVTKGLEAERGGDRECAARGSTGQ